MPLNPSRHIPKNYNMLRQLVEARNNYQESRLSYQKRIKALSKLGFKSSELDEEILRNMKRREGQLTMEYMKIVRKLPIWKEWLINVQGAGQATMGQLIAYIGDIKDFTSVAKLWSYFGLGIYDGKIQAYKKDHNHNFNGKRRALLYVISKTFVTHKHNDCLYADLYDKRKQKYMEKHPDYTKMHIHRMALREVAKVFLKHLWKNWRKIENVIKGSDHDGHVEKTDKEMSSLLLPKVVTS